MCFFSINFVIRFWCQLRPWVCLLDISLHSAMLHSSFQLYLFSIIIIFSLVHITLHIKYTIKISAGIVNWDQLVLGKNSLLLSNIKHYFLFNRHFGKNVWVCFPQSSNVLPKDNLISTVKVWYWYVL